MVGFQMLPTSNKSSLSLVSFKEGLWQISHSVALILATFMGLAFDSLWPVVAAGGISFVIFIVSGYVRGELGRNFGLPNSVTLLRLVGVLWLGVWGSHLSWYVAVASCLFLLTTDGVDGWVAHRLNQTSQLGDRFDRETDAFFTLILSLLLISRGLVGSWIATAGLLRYVTVLVHRLIFPTPTSEYRSSAAKVIYVISMGLMLASFVPFPRIAAPVAAVALLLLLGSFSRDYRWILSQR